MLFTSVHCVFLLGVDIVVNFKIVNINTGVCVYLILSEIMLTSCLLVVGCGVTLWQVFIITWSIVCVCIQFVFSRLPRQCFPSSCCPLPRSLRSRCALPK